MAADPARATMAAGRLRADGRTVRPPAPPPNRRAVRTGTMSGCPVCGGGHESCQFGPGSPYCVKTGCGNPHHRPDPIADLAAAGVMINAWYLDAEPASDRP